MILIKFFCIMNSLFLNSHFCSILIRWSASSSSFPNEECYYYYQQWELTFLELIGVQDSLLNALCGLYLLRFKITLHDIAVLCKSLNSTIVPTLCNYKTLNSWEHKQQQTRVYNSWASHILDTGNPNTDFSIDFHI